MRIENGSELWNAGISEVSDTAEATGNNPAFIGLTMGALARTMLRIDPLFDYTGFLLQASPIQNEKDREMFTKLHNEEAKALLEHLKKGKN